jgi:hypothetical protein
VDPPHHQPSTGQQYQVFGVPVGGGPDEQLLKTCDHAFEAAAFAKLVTSGGKFVRVRVESPASSGAPDSRRQASRDAREELPPPPGCAYKLLYVTTLLCGAAVSLGVGLVVAFYAVVYLFLAANVELSTGVLLAIAMAIGSVLFALFMKIHTRLFREHSLGP